MLNDELNSVLGIELRLLSDNLFSCRSCIVTKNANSVEIAGKKVSEGSLAKILEALPKQLPVALTLSGRGVVNKVVNSPKQNKDEMFAQAFASINKDEFYSQFFLKENIALVSIIRKESTDILLNRLIKMGFKVYALTLGGIATSHIWEELNIEKENMCFDGHTFEFSEQKTFISYRYDASISAKQTIKIANEAITEELLSAYAGAFQLIMHKVILIIDAEIPFIQIAFNQFIENAKLKRRSLIFLGCLFISLLISFLLFSYYNDENAQLARKVGSLNANADEVDLMKKNTAENQQILQFLGWNGGYSYAYLVNEIGKSMPRQVKLKELNFTAAAVEGEKSAVKISGETDNLVAVNNWIFLLKDKSWAKNVKLLKYQGRTRE